MAKKYPGFYLYYDWIDALESLPSKKAMAVIKNLRNYARDGIEPPALEGHAGSLQSIFAAQLKRSKTNAENGKLGGAPTHKKPDDTTENPPAEKPFAGPMTPEQLQSVSFTDYLRLKTRFDAEAAALQADPNWLQDIAFGRDDTSSL